MCPSHGLDEQHPGMNGDEIASAAINRATETALRHFDQDTLIRNLEEEVKRKLREELETLIRQRLSAVLERELPDIVREVYALLRSRG